MRMADTMPKNNDQTTTTTRAWVGLVLAGAVAVAGLAGCGGRADDARASRGDEFPAAGQPRAVDRLIDVQVAAGARSDATLYPHHFDAGELNSLGRQKLRSMLKDDDANEPLAIYLDLPRAAAAAGADDDAAKNDDDAAPATGPAATDAATVTESRRRAVTAFLADLGLPESQVRFHDGPNPYTGQPAEKALSALSGTSGGGAKPAAKTGTVGMSGGSGQSPAGK